MSEHLVHTAILNDTIRLLNALEKEGSPWWKVIPRHEAFAFLGCVTVAGDSFSFRLLEQLRGEGGQSDPYWAAKLAFVLGWVSHRACDRVMKVIWKEAPFKGRGTDVDPNISPYEASVYHEAEAFRLFFEEREAYRLAIFPEAMDKRFAAMKLRQPDAERLVQNSFAAQLMGIQTIPSKLDDQKRFEEIAMRVQKFYVDLGRYRRAIREPIPENYAAFVEDIHWYDPADPVIALTRGLEAGQAFDEAELMRGIAAETKSHYAQALQLSLSYVRAALQYLQDGALDMSWLRDKLDIGRLSAEGLAV